MDRSPFVVLPNVLTPAQCETLIKSAKFNETSPINDQVSADQLYDALREEIPGVLEYFDIETIGQSRPQYIQLNPGDKVEPHCENSEYLREGWVRLRNYDLTGIIFLNDAVEAADQIVEGQQFVFGGKLEFPQYNFGFNAQRGTMIVFPSTPNFINLTTDVKLGSLHYVKFHIAAKTPYLHDPEKFPGSYKTWF